MSLNSNKMKMLLLIAMHAYLELYFCEKPIDIRPTVLEI